LAGHCTRNRIHTFADLYFFPPPRYGLDFMNVAVPVGYIAAKLGEQEVAVFNTSYRIGIILTGQRCRVRRHQTKVPGSITSVPSKLAEAGTAVRGHFGSH
jgi:hypothetical protein